MPIPILFITSTSEMGGTERQLLHLLGAMDRAAFAPAVLSLQGDGELTRRVAEMEIPSRGLGDAAGWLSRRAAVRDMLLWHRPQLVHLYGLRADTLARGPARRAGAVVVSGIRNIDPWRRWWHVRLDRATARHVSLFISNSAAGRASRIRREKFAPRKIIVINNGIAVPDRSARQELAARFRRDEGLGEDDAPIVSLLGNYRGRKGHATAIRAFEEIAPAFPGAVLVFAGEDFEGGDIARLVAASKASRRIKALGFLPNPAPLHAATDLYIQPSLFEGTPNALMEAMAWGTPCIASRVGGVGEVMRDGREGVLVPPEDPSALAEAMRDLLTDRGKAKRLGEAARRRIEDSFGIPAMARAHDTAYRGLLGRGRGGNAGTGKSF